MGKSKVKKTLTDLKKYSVIKSRTLKCLSIYYFFFDMILFISVVNHAGSGLLYSKHYS